MNTTRILLVDDEKSLLLVMNQALQSQVSEIHQAETAEQALSIMEDEEFDLVITDLKLPGLSGLELFQEARNRGYQPDFVIITAFASAASAIQALKLGASDYLMKPFDLEELRIVVNRILSHRSMKEDVKTLKHQLMEDVDTAGIIGKTPGIRSLLQMVRQAAPTDLAVLITGESGTGKELVAKAVHKNSKRKEGRFLSVNCAALPESLLEAELFGVMKGAYTGAVSSRKGLFELADGGTLFLDEIGEMPLSMQSKLLRVLQEFVIRRVGGERDIHVDVRIVAATNRNLEDLIRGKQFRQDLFFRINVFHLQLPPLRERQEDIAVLAEHFIRRISRRLKMAAPRISPDALKRMENYSWPGNIRELENVVERILAFSPGEVILPEHLPEEINRGPGALSEVALSDRGIDVERELRQIRYLYMIKAMEKCEGHMNEAASLLGMTFRSFRYHFHKLCEEFGTQTRYGE
ncbi:MAG: sigma-54-dependent Fis family transcriptional regulator [Acidobacteria bacterium]|nr:sigma-54-dependent Fis family transcriptional regulator [Acidobacteriota bacterium]